MFSINNLKISFIIIHMFRNYYRQDPDYNVLVNKLNDIENKLNVISSKLDKLENIKENTDKMEKHITFIHSVYDRVKTPLYWVCDKINVLSYYPMSESHRLKERISKIEAGVESETKNDILSQD